MLCKIWGFYGGDYEQCRLLGYKNPVCTSHGTYYISATGPSRLILCMISGFHGGGYEECRFLECDAVWVLQESTFGRNVSPPSSVWKESSSSLILSTLMMEEIRSSEMLVLSRATRRHIPEDGIPHSRRRENLKSYTNIYSQKASKIVNANIRVDIFTHLTGRNIFTDKAGNWHFYIHKVI
jgi:hypothetical protein